MIVSDYIIQIFARNIGITDVSLLYTDILNLKWIFYHSCTNSKSHHKRFLIRSTELDVDCFDGQKWMTNYVLKMRSIKRWTLKSLSKKHLNRQVGYINQLISFIWSFLRLQNHALSRHHERVGERDRSDAGR